MDIGDMFGLENINLYHVLYTASRRAQRESLVGRQHAVHLELYCMVAAPTHAAA